MKGDICNNDKKIDDMEIQNNISVKIIKHYIRYNHKIQIFLIK